MQQRRPRTALQTSALPSLAALLATGVVVDGCAGPTADADRGERLARHGENAARAFRDNRFSDAVHEIGVGLGLIDSPTGVGDIGPAGAVPITNPQPPIMQPSGAIAPVQPTPPPPTVHPSGAAPMVQPQPPTPPVVHHPPAPRPAVPGGLGAVHPQPPPPVESAPAERGRP